MQSLCRKKTDNTKDNILNYQLRQTGYIYDDRFDNETGKFLRENGVKEDKKLIEELIRKKKQELDDQKILCPGCGKKVFWSNVFLSKNRK